LANPFKLEAAKVRECLDEEFEAKFFDTAIREAATLAG